VPCETALASGPAAARQSQMLARKAIWEQTATTGPDSVVWQRHDHDGGGATDAAAKSLRLLAVQDVRQPAAQQVQAMQLGWNGHVLRGQTPKLWLGEAAETRASTLTTIWGSSRS